MKVVQLLSGGKDSIYSLARCVAHGHEPVCLANLHPPAAAPDEGDSFMFQVAGHDAVAAQAQCLGLPLVRRPLLRGSKQQGLTYERDDEDEVEDLFELLQAVLAEHPQVDAVSCGALFSAYQRVRVENVCARLGLTSLAYLWRRDQAGLLAEMVGAGVDAVLCKVASIGLDPHRHLGKSLLQLSGVFASLHARFEFHVCGEGGEYETLVLDGPLFRDGRLVLDATEVVMHSDDAFAPVGLLRVLECHAEPREPGDEPPEVPPAPGPATPPDVADEAAIEFLPAAAQAEEPPLLTVSASGGHVAVAGAHGPADADVGAQVDAALSAAEAALAAHGCSLADCLFVFLTVADMGDFGAVNEAYCRRFGQLPASRSCVEAARLRGGRLVEVACVAQARGAEAVRGAEPLLAGLRSVLHVQSVSEWAPVCIGPYSQANVLLRALVWSAGQIGLFPPTMALVGGGARAQLWQALANHAAVLDALDASLARSLLRVVYVAPAADTAGLRVVLEAGCRAFSSAARSADDDDERPPDSGFSDDDEAEEEQAAAALAQPPTLWVQVPRLPRDALVEVELLSAAGSALGYSVQELAGGGGRAAVVPRALCVAAVAADSPAELRAALEEALAAAGLGWGHTSLVRVFALAAVGDLGLPAGVALSVVHASGAERPLSATLYATRVRKLQTGLWLGGSDV